MNKLEALQKLCEGKCVKQGDYVFKLNVTNRDVQLQWYSNGVWLPFVWFDFFRKQWEYWQEVDEPKEMHGWEWAMEQLQNGKNIRWHDWKENVYIYLSYDGEIISEDSRPYEMSNIRYFTKKGWILADD